MNLTSLRGGSRVRALAAVLLMIKVLGCQAVPTGKYLPTSRRIVCLLQGQAVLGPYVERKAVLQKAGKHLQAYMIHGHRKKWTGFETVIT